MISSNDTQSNDFSTCARAQYISKYIDNAPETQRFRYPFYSKFLSDAFQKPLEKKEALAGVFNNVSVTLLRMPKSFMTNGYTDIGLLEHEDNKIILTGQIIKRNLSNPAKFFELSDNDPEAIISEIFTQLNLAYDDFEAQYPDEHKRREAIIGSMTTLHSPQEIFDIKVSPFVI